MLADYHLIKAWSIPSDKPNPTGLNLLTLLRRRDENEPIFLATLLTRVEERRRREEKRKRWILNMPSTLYLPWTEEELHGQ